MLLLTGAELGLGLLRWNLRLELPSPIQMMSPAMQEANRCFLQNRACDPLPSSVPVIELGLP